MPSVTKRRQVSSAETERSPKKKKLEPSSTNPASSPIKGPLQDHADTNSPTFVAKCFYGFKKSHQSKVVQQVTPTKVSPRNSRRSSAKKKQQDVKVENMSTRVDQLMSEMIAGSPIKQRLFESCTKAEFRKLYSNEYKKLENLVRKESVRMTRRTSKIVHSRSEESEESSESSDNEEVIFEVSNTALDTDSEEENVENNLPQKSHVEKSVNDTFLRNGSKTLIEKCPTSGSQIESSTPNLKSNVGLTPNGRHLTPGNQIEKSKLKLNGNKSDNSTSSSGSEKRFFKTRTPVDNSKMYGIVRGKGFDLKVVPKTLQALFEKKSMKAQQKRSSPLSSCKKVPDSQGISESNKSCISAAVENDSGAPTDSAVGPSSPEGFWFAPGFLSPEKDASEDSPDNHVHTGNEVEDHTDAGLSLNKSNKVTYEKTPPPKKSILANSGCKSPVRSANVSPSDSVNLLPFEEAVNVAPGSEDLFSSQGHSPSRSKQKEGENNPRSQERTLENGISTSRYVEDIGGSSPGNMKEPEDSNRKLFPVFNRRSARLASSPLQQKRSPVTNAKAAIASPKDPNQEQMILDAGQKKFGATQCPVCCMVYCHADPGDEAAHSKFHKRLLEALKYRPWKNPRVLQEYPEDLGEVIMVLADDPKHIRKKVDEVNQVMARELGFPDSPSSFMNRRQKVFLYVYEKEIAGCCVAEPIKEGFRIIPGDMDTTETSGQRPWRSSEVPEPAFVGISRLWVSASRRKAGIATKLVDCVRQWFDYGTLTPHHRVAFSDPTPDGRKFAQKYMRSNTFLVYKYNPNHLH